jgi:uncharacterized protein (DUF58 family)
MTHAHARVVLLTSFGVLVALTVGRPDLVVLLTPLALVTGWGALTRPHGAPAARLRQSRTSITEGEHVLVGFEVDPVEGQDFAAGSLATAEYVEAPGGRNARVLMTPEPGDASSATLSLRVTRWGRRRLGPALIGGCSAWGAFRYGPEPVAALPVGVVPQAGMFDTRADAPSPRGLIGRHRSLRPGEGTEFATIRPFQWGDRLKRIHWARSLRAGALHVSTTYADQDTHVAMVLDAHYDLGRSEGVDARPSSLDESVRAAAAVAEHFLAQGDRVSLRVLSHRSPLLVPPGSGRSHRVRIQDCLSRVRPGAPMGSTLPPLRLRPGALVVLVSAMVSPQATATAAMLAAGGFPVVMLDTLGDQVQPEDEDAVARIAWRIRMLERQQEIAAVRGRGVPVVPWVGAGSLDSALRQMGRGRR